MPFDRKVIFQFPPRVEASKINENHIKFGAPHLPVSMYEHKYKGRTNTEKTIEIEDHHAFGHYLISEGDQDNLSILTGLSVNLNIIYK